MKKGTETKRIWIGRTLVVCQATFAKGKNTSLDIKAYDADNVPPSEIMQMTRP